MADDKVRLPEMLLWVGSEITRLESWERVLADEGKRLDPGKARDLACARQVEQTLLLVGEFEPQIVDMVTAHRARQRREMKAAPAPKTPTESTPGQETEAPPA